MIRRIPLSFVVLFVGFVCPFIWLALRPPTLEQELLSRMQLRIKAFRQTGGEASIYYIAGPRPVLKIELPDSQKGFLDYDARLDDALFVDPELFGAITLKRQTPPKSLIEFLPRMRNLDYLSIYGTYWEEQQLGKLPTSGSLRVLVLRRVGLTDDQFQDCFACESLVQLDLEENPVRARWRDGMQWTDTIWSIGLSTTQVDDESLAGWPIFSNLQGLHLNNTRVSDAGLIHLAKHPKLRHVSLSGTRATQEGIDMLKDMRPDLDISY